MRAINANSPLPPMTLTDVPLLSMLREKMAWLNSRQAILSQNVANADMPGYAARDLKPIDFAQSLRDATHNNAGTLRITDPRHIEIRNASAEFQEEQSGQGA